MYDPELYKGSMCIATGEGTQWYEHPVVRFKGAKHNTVSEAAIACGIIEVLYRDLVHCDDHRTILRTRFERAFVMFFSDGPLLDNLRMWHTAVDESLDAQSYELSFDRPAVDQ